MSKPKIIVESLQENQLFWKIPFVDVKKGTIVQVKDGNGAVFYAKNKKAFQIPYNSLYEAVINEKDLEGCVLYGYVTEPTKSFTYGVSGVPFKDIELNYDTVIGFHGKFSIEIIDPKRKLFNDFVEKNNDFEPTILEMLRPIASQYFSKTLNGKLDNKRKTYDTIQDYFIDISELIQKDFDEKLNETYGIRLTSLNIESPLAFEQEYKEARKKYTTNLNELNKLPENKLDHEMAIINSLLNMPLSETQKSEQKNKPSQKDNLPKKTCYCPTCGTKIYPSDNYCPVCGTHIE